MNDLSQAAEMGLEALEIIWATESDFFHYQDEIKSSVQALRKALAEPEQYDQTALELCEKCGWKAIMPDEGCLVCARRKQKPVAIVNSGMGGIEWLEEPLPDDTPLYNAPPISDYHEGWEEGFKAGKREWVGLTRRELDIATLGLEDLGDCYLAIEAKLKEKNT